MPPHLPSGRYVISNYGLGEPFGHLRSSSLPTRTRPIISTSDRPLWAVQHVEGNLYRLTIDGLIAVSEYDLIWSDSNDRMQKSWRIEQKGDKANQYIIIDPDHHSDEDRVWAIKEGDTQVSLKDLSKARLGVSTQIWLFDPIRDNHRQIQQKLELVPGPRIYRYGSHGYLSGLIHYFGSSADVASFVIEPNSPEDLVKIMTYVAKNQVPFAVKGGGHTSNPGFSSTRGIQISMSRLNDIVYHHDDETVDIGAGCVFREVYNYLPRTRNIVGAYAASRVGVSGWLLGGGYSPKTNQYGLGIDHIVAVQIVVPNDNGKIALKTVTKDDDEELFWAIKGGGNNFGIVTKFTLDTHPQDKVYGGVLVYTADQLEVVKSALMDFIYSRQPRNKRASIEVAFRHYPGNKFEIVVLVFFDGPLPTPNPFQRFIDIPRVRANDELGILEYDSLDRSMSRVHDFIGPLELELSEGDTSPSDRAIPRPAIPGMGLLNIRARWGNVMVSEYNRELIIKIEEELDAAKAHISEWNGKMIAAGIWPFRAKMFENSAGGAWPHERQKPNGPFHFYFYWEGEQNDEKWIGQLKTALKNVREKAIEEGCAAEDAPVYLNTALAEDDYATVENIYRGNLDKLRGLRRKYDPSGVMDRTGGFRIPFPATGN